MPKSKPKHKGRAKRYVTPEEMEEQEQRRKREQEWKRKKGLPDQKEEESESDDEGAVGGADRPRPTPGDLPPSSSSSEEESDEEEEIYKQKGVEGLIEISNPNRVASKLKKAKDIDINAKVELSRREREEIQKQRDVTNYRKLHAAGLTDEAQRDMARLALVRKQREEAAKKREMERQAAEAKKKAEAKK